VDFTVYWYWYVDDLINGLVDELFNGDWHINVADLFYGDAHDLRDNDRHIIWDIHTTLDDLVDGVRHRSLDDLLYRVWYAHFNRDGDVHGCRHRDRSLDNALDWDVHWVWDRFVNQALNRYGNLYWNPCDDLPWHLYDLFHDLFHWVRNLLLYQTLDWVGSSAFNDLFHWDWDLDFNRHGHGSWNGYVPHNRHVNGDWNIALDDAFYRVRHLYVADLFHWNGYGPVDELLNWHRYLHLLGNDYFVGLRYGSVHWSVYGVWDIAMDNLVHWYRNGAVHYTFNGVRHLHGLWHGHLVRAVNRYVNQAINRNRYRCVYVSCNGVWLRYLNFTRYSVGCRDWGGYGTLDWHGNSDRSVDWDIDRERDTILHQLFHRLRNQTGVRALDGRSLDVLCLVHDGRAGVSNIDDA
jgi:hypothetical protein